MRVHGNQINPYAQLDALYAAEKAAAKREAARTRKKLAEFASKLAADAGEDCVVQVGARDESHEQSAQNQQSQSNQKQQKGPADSEGPDNFISDWV